MSRYAKANQSIEDLKALIKDKSDKDYGEDGSVYGILHGDYSPTQRNVYKDLGKIEVDFENVEEFGTEDSYNHLPGLEDLDGYEMIGEGDKAFPILWCAGGGDWELPLVFVLYIGQKGELRGYIPEDGNCYNKEKKAAYGNNDGDPEFDSDDSRYVFDVAKMRAAVANRILVKGEAGSGNAGSGNAGSGNGGEAPLTFRQLIQSLKDFEDQYASVMPVAKDAEASCWGIEYIWFEDGVLQLGQHDDEGLTCDLIAERAEGCIPSELLDSPARVKVGVTEKPNGVMTLYTADGEPCVEHLVKSSVVKPCRGNDWFCKWTLKFV